MYQLLNTNMIDFELICGAHHKSEQITPKMLIEIEIHE